MENKYSLPNMTHKFKIQVQGNESGINWAGEFTYRRPSLGARSRIEVLRARLSGDLETVSPETQILNEMLAHLRYTLEAFPDWWSETSHGFDLYDGKVISEIFNKCMEFEGEWKRKVLGGEAKSVEESVDDVHTEFTSGNAEQHQNL